MDWRTTASRVLADFDKATVEESKRVNIRVKKADKKTGDEIQADRLLQANGQRKWFFRWAVVFAAVTVLTSAALVVGMVFFGYGIKRGEGIDTAIVVAFVSGLTLESLGILGVIATYLYPTGKGAE